MDQQQLIDRLREWWAEPGWLTSTDPDKADLLAAAASEIERLREERRWIPVGERLPEDEADVICGYAGFKSFPGYRQGFNWFDERDSHLAFPPTHWMPLPAPPEKEE